MIKIYHNPRCKTSRAGLEFLKNITDDFEVVKYLANQLTKKELTNLIDKSGMKPESFLRTQERFYKNELKGRELTDEQIIDAMVKEPKLIHRPIVENNRIAILAQPPEEIKKLF